MKRILITLISVYQLIFSPMFRQVFGTQCRYTTTCSQYAKQVIAQQGVLKGTKLAIFRILSCQPFTKSYGHI